MKNLATLLVITLLFAGQIFAQLKTIEDSGKKPKWISGVIKDYIIVVGTGKDVEEAKRNALISVKESVAKSVADYVKSSSELSKSESYGTMSSYFETYNAKTTTQTADIPALKGISESKVEAYWWEKVQNKKTGDIAVNYHVKYPFSELELGKIIMEFKILDKELTEKLNLILEEADTISSVERMIQNIAELSSMMKGFLDARKTKCETGIAKYNSMLQSISLVPMKNDLGDLTYATKLGDRFVYTMQKPQIVSHEKCAQVTSITSDKSNWFVKYKYQNCFDNPANALTVKYMFNGKIVTNNFHFDINKNKVDVFLKNDINFTTVAQDGKNITESKCEITVVSKYASPFIIEKVVFNVEDQAPIIFNNVNAQFEGRGDHELVLKCTQALNKEKYSANNRTSGVGGTINYKNVATGEKGTYKIFDQKYSTDW
ncbi:MAG: hypothetical protein A2275_01080 [Bacteroidetes bacterium RIFOXYA12_FULL_35_11]|nr:MAG: hypothetical protein A2X01_20060 [Bacteroidetes bacterium GWF2_35_48]OFY77168.1 MAG: hypothetical protein A2275_01080 [Bacteroidetes bacterium RIFOXYA12_FULL_35_11]OFY93258.1 MAG: hypothetical protein A2491_16195 [Bacteroidetes bacterium RIFOXYC12_FULL_35_7]OFY97818.1 MAG: hypothetical protein A2309_13285 [Bacteroidetes bacterium RIFOXYB2_FULL_35_7]HBX50112.1 hypothetical protein [Bacteroidales bacterium]